MTRALAETLGTGLPPLGGKLVLAYRVAWFALALAAAGALAGSLNDAMAHPAVFALRLVKAAILVAVCAILLRRRANDPVAALLSLALLTWAVSSSFDFTSGELLPRLLDRVRYLFFVLALLLFPDGRWRPRWTRPLAGVSIVVFVVGVGEAMGLFPTSLYLPLAVACVLGAIAGLIARFRTAETEAVRQQLKWIALGLVAGVGSILSARAGAAAAGASIVWEALFQLGIVAIALGFLVSLLRYRLFDAESAISRSAALAGVTVAVVATFAGTEATIELVGQEYLGMGIGDISAAMAAAVAAVLLNPLHNRISQWAEGRFQRDLVLLKRELPEQLAELSASAGAAELGAAILTRVCQSVHATRSALVADRKAIAVTGVDRRRVRDWARVAPADAVRVPGKAAEDPLFPVRLALHCPFSGRSAWLLLGPRPDGSLYGRDDLDAIEAIGPAIRHALSWTFERERARRRERRAHARLAALEARLAAVEAGGGDGGCSTSERKFELPAPRSLIGYLV